MHIIINDALTPDIKTVGLNPIINLLVNPALKINIKIKVFQLFLYTNTVEMTNGKIKDISGNNGFRIQFEIGDKI